MLSPEVPDLRGVGADDKPRPNIADDGQQVFHTFALIAELAYEAFLLPNHRERHALRLIRDRLLVGPVGSRYAPAEVDERFFRNVDAEGRTALCSAAARSFTGS